MLPYAILIFYSSIPNILPNHTISEKISKNTFDYMELTVDGSYSMWNSLSKLEKEWNLKGWSAKMPHGLVVFYFVLEDFPRGVTHFYGSSLAMTFDFSRISKTNLTSVEYLKKHFINHSTTILVFFWNRPLIDRWTFCSRFWDI